MTDHPSADRGELTARDLWLTWIGAALPMIILPVVIASILTASAGPMTLSSDKLAALGPNFRGFEGRVTPQS